MKLQQWTNNEKPPPNANPEFWTLPPNWCVFFELHNLLGLMAVNSWVWV